MHRVHFAALAAAIVALHVVGFALLAAGAVGVGLGLTAYTLGLRHAFDADHIAAIDGTTRKLGVAATARASFGPYNVTDDVDALLDSLTRARDIFHG